MGLADSSVNTRDDIVESISFSKNTGIGAGVPILGDFLQVYIDKPIKSNLLLSNKQHSIWYYTDVQDRIRFCGTPSLSLDIRPTSAAWQVVAYVFGVDRTTKEGTLLTHGSYTCWNCTAGERHVRAFELRSLCDEIGGLSQGGLALAINLYSDLYQPANAGQWALDIFYTDNFSLSMPIVEDTQREEFSAAAIVV